MKTLTHPDFCEDIAVSIDIVVIHGLYGKDDSSWTNVPWETEILPRSTKQSRLSLFDYDAFGLNGGILTRSGARNEAIRLLDSLQHLRRTKLTPIILIAHDLGGSILKEAMVLAQNRKYKDVYTYVSILVFLGCPHRDLSKVKLQSTCADILLSHDKMKSWEALELAGPLADWVIETNDAFAETRLSISASSISLVSSHADPRQRLFDRISASADLLREVVIVTELSHKDLLQHPVLRSNAADVEGFGVRLDAKVMRRFNSLLWRAPPQYPLGAPAADDEKEVGLFDSQGHLRDWLLAEEARLVLVDAPVDSIELAQRIYRWTTANDCDLDPVRLGYFVFDPDDCRRDSAEAMLSTVLAQIYSRFLSDKERENVSNADRFFDICHKPQLEDIYAVFSDIYLQSTVNAREKEPGSYPIRMLILVNLHNKVRNGIWLFRKLRDTVADCKLKIKIAIISSDPTSLISDPNSKPVARMTHISTIPTGSKGNLKYGKKEENDDSGQHENRTEKQISSNTLVAEPNKSVSDTAYHDPWLFSAIQAQPRLHGYDQLLKKLVQSCGKDCRLQRMIIAWLRVVTLPEKEALTELLSQLWPVTPHNVFKAMLSSMHPETHSWSATMLERVMFAFRPLTLAELQDWELQGIPEADGVRRRNTLQDKVERILSGLLMVYHQEIRLGHPDLRDFLLTSKDIGLGDWIPSKPESSSHKRIADSCLRYLIAPTARHLMRQRTTGPDRWHTAFERRDNFLSYATKYWVRHAKLAENEGSFESDACKQFMADEDAVGLWAAFYWTLLQPPTQPAAERDDQPCEAIRCLEILAENEAEDLLVYAMSKYRTSTIFRIACFDALIAAAAAGNIRMVKELIKVPLPEDQTLDRPILAAIESGDTEVFAELIRLVREAPERIRDAAVLLARAASLGRMDIAKIVLGLTKANPKSHDFSDAVSPLSYACQRGFSAVVDLLIHEGVDISADKNRPYMLAAKFGQLKVLDSLEPSATALSFRQVIKTSSRFGQRKPVQSTLDYIKRRLRPCIDASVIHESSGQIKAEDEHAIVAYLTEQILEVSVHSDAINEAIEMQCLDLIGPLMRTDGEIEQDDFSNVLANRMESAIKTGNLDVVRLVFEHGTKSMRATKENLALTATRALRTAISSNVPACIPYLVENGADITSRHLNGQTPLFHAVYFQLVRVAKALIDCNANANASGDGDWDPIHGAFDNAKITRLLIAAGADVDSLTVDDGHPAIWYAARWGHNDVVNELLKGNPGQVSLQAGLKAAIIHARPHILEKLLAYCPDTSYLPDMDDILHVQVEQANLKALELLLGFGVDVNRCRDNDGNTALHCLSQDTSVDVIKILIKRGANMELLNNTGETPLTVAVQGSNVPAVQYLVDRGARVNIPGGYWGGPFHLACHKSTLDVVHALRASKTDPADVDQVDPGVMGTPLQAALQREETDDKHSIVRYLVEAGAQINVPSPSWGGALFPACLTCTPNTIRMLIDRGADIKARDHVGRMPIHFALYRTMAHVELLLEPGHDADLSAVDVTQRHALHYAVVSGRLDLVKFVLDRSKEDLVDRPDEHDWTPLLWALRVTSHWGVETGQRKEIVQELLARGARRLVRGQGLDRTWTPLKLAKFYSLDDDVVREVQPTEEELETDEGQSWDWRSSGGTRGSAFSRDAYCDQCLMTHCGVFYDCIECNGATSYCFKCYQSKDKLHPPDHEFYALGAEEDDVDIETYQSVEEIDEGHSEGGSGQDVESDRDQGVLSVVGDGEVEVENVAIEENSER